MLDGSHDRQITLDQLLTMPSAEVIAMFQNDLRMYAGSLVSGISLFVEEALSLDEKDTLIHEVMQNIKWAWNAYNYMLTYLEKLCGESVERSELYAEDAIVSREAMSPPISAIMSNFRVEFRRVTSPIEGYAALLSLGDLSSEERNEAIIELAHYVSMARELCNSMLIYLEKFQFDDDDT
ncbi:MAG: hypothetical protein ABI690_14420 [Chloroflexota bacterium]